MQNDIDRLYHLKKYIDCDDKYTPINLHYPSKKTSAEFTLYRTARERLINSNQQKGLSF